MHITSHMCEYLVHSPRAYGVLVHSFFGIHGIGMCFYFPTHGIALFYDYNRGSLLFVDVLGNIVSHSPIHERRLLGSCEVTEMRIICKLSHEMCLDGSTWIMRSDHVTFTQPCDVVPWVMRGDWVNVLVHW